MLIIQPLHPANAYLCAQLHQLGRDTVLTTDQRDIGSNNEIEKAAREGKTNMNTTVRA